MSSHATDTGPQRRSVACARFAEDLTQERHGQAPLRRQRGAIEPIERRAEAGSIARQTRQQPVQRGGIEREAAPLRPQTQQGATAGIIQR